MPGACRWVGRAELVNHYDDPDEFWDGRKVTVGLRAISLESPENSFYQHLMGQYRDQPTTD
ncbi:hypothetical protein [Nocardia gamkensis]|uniref:hypothetical protein n=1 Tax=Nocardia gamkensis TaxID=352869 RepID=UPI0037C655EB